jgi:CubicO group peptidase (beta-lactamase class C family)
MPGYQRRGWLLALWAILGSACLGDAPDAVVAGETVASGAVVLGAPGPTTTLHIHRHSAATGAEVAFVEGESWSAGWSHVREFHTASGSFLFLLKRGDGSAQVWRLAANGTLDALVQSYALPKGITSVGFVYPDDQPVLLLHERQTGRFMTWSTAQDGRITGITSDQTRPELRYKDEVRPFFVGNSRYVIAVDRWYGAAAILPLTASGTLSPSASAVLDSNGWTAGWSSTAFYHHGGDSFVILYKIADGEVGVKQINADGSLPAGWVQHQNWNGGWTDLVARDDKLFMYRSDTGKLTVRALGPAGVGAVLHEGNIGGGWTGLSAYEASGSLYLAKVNEEGRVPFDHQMAARFKDVVVAGFGGGKTMGYQVGVMQSGKIVLLHADGWAHFANSTTMTTRSKQSVASVSKMVTTVSTLKLIDDGELAWNDRLIDHLPVATSTPHANYYHLASNAPLHSSLEDVRISELLTYTARFGKDGTDNVLSLPRDTDACDATHADPTWTPDPEFRCKRNYQNSAFGVAGYTIAAKAGLSLLDGDEDPEAFDTYLDDLWMRDAYADGMICGDHPATAHYAACTSGANCVLGYREVGVGGARYCSSGNWMMNSEDALQLMAAMRYGRVLSATSTDLLFSLQKRRDGGDMTVGWDGAEELDGGMRYGKSGGSSGVDAYVMHFPRGVDAVLFTNASPCNGCAGVKGTLLDAYAAAITP